MIRWICLIAMLSVISIFSAPVLADSAGDMVVVFDASGSMWGQVDGTAKITIAREVLTEVIESWDSDQKVGLIAYGHRKKGDCTDIEELIPVSPVDKSAFIEAVRALNPKGKTPLTAAVKMAAESLKYTENKATVILLSDGLETCDEDPCKAAQLLESAGVDFTAHVIGFGLSDTEKLDTLKCIAEETGGNFLTADNADTLKESLEQTVREVKRAESNITFQGVLDDGSVVNVDLWQIFPDDGCELNHANRIYSSGAAEPETYLEPGNYIVRATRALVSNDQKFTVTEGETRTIRVKVDEQAKIIIRVVETSGGESVDPKRWEIFTSVLEGSSEEPTSVYTGYNRDAERYLLPGTYEITAEYGQVEARQTFTVEAGEIRDLEVVLPAQGEIEVKAVYEPGGEAQTLHKYEIYTRSEPDSQEKPKRVMTRHNSGGTYVLKPGKYTITAKYEQATAFMPFVVKPGEKTLVEIVMPEQGKIALSAVDGRGKPVKVHKFEVYTVVPENSTAEPERIQRKYGSKAELFLLPGTYRVIASVNKREYSETVTIEPGKRLVQEFVITD